MTDLTSQNVPCAPLKGEPVDLETMADLVYQNVPCVPLEGEIPPQVEVPFNELVERLGELRRAIADGREPRPPLSGRKCNSGVSTPLSKLPGYHGYNSGTSTPVIKYHGCHSRGSSTTASPMCSSRDSLQQCASRSSDTSTPLIKYRGCHSR